MEMDAGGPVSAEENELNRLRSRLAETEERLLRASHAERILQQLTSSARDFAIILLTTDGRVSLWNEGAERLLGYLGREIQGQAGRVIFTPEDRERGAPEEELQNAALTGRAVDENWLQRKDGSRFWASGVCTSIRSPAGDLEGYVKILRDQTSRKALEDELRRLNGTLEDKVRERTAELEDALKEMAAFSYSIAHDLRAPLRSMAGFAQALDEEYRDILGETGREYAHRILQSAKSMNEMIEDLLEYSRLTQTEVLCHPIDPAIVLDRVLEKLAPDIAERRAVVAVDRPFPEVLAHEVTLAQVFTNLIGNALKFVATGVEPRIRVYAENQPPWVRIWVEDNGIGIAPVHRSKIFGIFERLHSGADYPGTGIGLAIVNRAIERLKGRVGVESGESGGSSFWIDLRSVARS